jgi:pyruvate/2-oxoglutarate dehydrogenase complex dihydrolipoamide dehydrogenase (E3) component
MAIMRYSVYQQKEKIIQNKIAMQIECELAEGYLKVNNKQQITVSNIYAAGDINTDIMPYWQMAVVR